MNVNMNTLVALNQASGSNETAMAVFKIAIDSEKQGAMALISTMPQQNITSADHGKVVAYHSTRF